MKWFQKEPQKGTIQLVDANGVVLETHEVTITSEGRVQTITIDGDPLTVNNGETIRIS
jgi:hypothetical protein